MLKNDSSIYSAQFII